MPQVSLIALRSDGSSRPSALLAAARAGLEEAGFGVEVLVVSDPTGGRDFEPVEPWCESSLAPAPGLAAAAVAGLRASGGDLIVLLDAGRGYSPEDVIAVVGRLATRRVDLVVASEPRPLSGPIARRLLGSTDPRSGLIGLSREAAIEVDAALAPVGPRFAVELLGRSRGRCGDVPVGKAAGRAPRSAILDDIRLAKRLADDRWGTASRLIQFCVVGASGMAVDLTCYALFQALLGRTALAELRLPMVEGTVDLAASAVLAIATALTWNFSLNRRLTFNDARGGPVGVQYLRYVASNLLGIGVSLSLRLALPGSFGFFARHRLAAAVAGIVAATGISFTMARWFVFDRSDARPARSPGRPRGRKPDPAKLVIAGRHATPRRPVAAASTPAD